jgi:excisionase family DNA binding protein
MARLLSIGEVARELDMSPARLRHLADRGVIPVVRTEGGHRRFDLAAVRRAAADGLRESDLMDDRPPAWERQVILNGLQEDEVWRTVEIDVLHGQVTPPARSIAAFAFTEMLNNAIDHSGAESARVAVWISDVDVRFEVSDAGRGALPNVRETLGLEDDYDALGELTKGRTTTDPDRHTGEGIFFTSKAVDVFTLESAGIRWTVDNLRNDHAVGRSDVHRGTRVRWQLDPQTTRPLADVFREYTDENYDFARTRTVVRLFGLGVRFVSRSEAKRLMRGLERFSEVVLDFTGVDDVGQGFVDEALRVWPSHHPGTSVDPVGMSGPVEFMVRRGLPRGPRTSEASALPDSPR